MQDFDSAQSDKLSSAYCDCKLITELASTLRRGGQAAQPDSLPTAAAN